MIKRSVSVIAVLAILLAACGGGAGDESSTTSGGGTSTTASADAPEAVLLSYSLQAGTEFHYAVSLSQHIEMTASGDSSLAADQDFPGSAAVDLTATADFTYSVAAGADPGTYDVTITGSFDDVGASGTVDGEPIESGEIPDFASVDPVNVTVTVDEQGNLISEGSGEEDPTAGLLGGMGSMTGAPVPGLDPGQFFGPPFTTDEVTVGDTWSDQIETPGLSDEPVVTSVTSTVTGSEDTADGTVFIVETTTSTTPIEFDFGEFLIGMFGALMPEDATDQQRADFESALDDLRFVMSVDDARSEGTVRFDPAAGVTRQSDTDAGAHIAMDMNIPDETTGEMASFAMDMTISQQIGYQLLSAPGA